MNYTEIKFCQIDKPESHSFQLDFWNEIDGIITYSNIKKYNHCLLCLIQKLKFY